MDARALRTQLRDKTKWSQANVSNRLKSLCDRHVVTRETALMYLAHTSGISLERHGATAEDLQAVRELTAKINGSNEMAPGTSRQQPAASTPTRRVHAFSAPEFPVTDVPQFVAEQLTAARRRSGEAYGVASVLEQSVRELIRRLMSAEYGEQWWSEVPRGPRKNAEYWMQQDHDDPWHDPRGDHALDYLSFSEYSQIITSQKLWRLFEPVLKRTSLAEEVLRDANVSRRTIAHMGELSVEDFDHLKAATRKWLKTLRANEHLIP